MVFGDQITRQKSLKTNTMNEVFILKKFLTAVTPNMHKVRRVLNYKNYKVSHRTKLQGQPS
jgi:hypothetical protein